MTDLIDRCTAIVGLPYLDLRSDCTKQQVGWVAVLAGGGGGVAFYQEAESLEVDCLIVGGVTSKIDNDLGRVRQAEIEQHLMHTPLTAIGLSHAGSEFVVMRDVAALVEEEVGIAAEAIPESHWWR